MVFLSSWYLGHSVTLFPCSAQVAIWFGAAKKLHRAMWQQNDLEKRLRKVEGLKYLPPNEVKDLRLDALGCDTQTILFREEYFYILEELERRRPNIGGVVTGHPGIGTNLLQKDLSCLAHVFITFRKISFSVLFASPTHQRGEARCTTTRRIFLPFF